MFNHGYSDSSLVDDIMKFNREINKMWDIRGPSSNQEMKVKDPLKDIVSSISGYSYDGKLYARNNKDGGITYFFDVPGCASKDVTVSADGKETLRVVAKVNDGNRERCHTYSVYPGKRWDVKRTESKCENGVLVVKIYYANPAEKEQFKIEVK